MSILFVLAPPLARELTGREETKPPGGIAGRKINFIYYDDAFNPAKTVEQTRRLIEGDEVAFLFSMLGTAPNSAVVKYINSNKVPHLFLSVNGDKWGDYQNYPSSAIAATDEGRILEVIESVASRTCPLDHSLKNF